MRLSVIVCAYTLDRWTSLQEAIASCSNQTRQPDEVIVVIDYNDELLERSRNEFTGATVISNTMTKGLSGARNSGVVASAGDVLGFLDDDAYGETDWLATLVRPFDDPLVAGSGGWIVPHWEGPEPKWFPRTFLWILGCSYNGLPESGARIRNPIGASMALRRGVFTLVGGFSAGLGRIGTTPLGCEETELCIRYGVRRPDDVFVLVRDSVVHHRVPLSRCTWSYFLRRCWAEGLSKAAVASLVGHDAGLAAERRHVASALPREVLSSLRAIPREPGPAIRRIASVVVGGLVALAGLIRGTVAVRSHPVSLKSVSLQSGATTLDGPRYDAKPIDIFQYDIDTPSSLLQIPAGSSERLWLEIVRDEQVLGRQELWNDDPTALRRDLDDIAARYADRRSTYVDVSDESLPPISVVVPTTCRAPEQLRKLIESLSSLDYPEFEVIVVDNQRGSRSLMPDFTSLENVKVIREIIPGASAARNRGILVARHELIAFTDDDVVVDRRWLRALGGRFVASPEISAVGGLVLPAELLTLPQLWFEEFFGGFSHSFRLQIASLAHHPDDELFPYAAGRYASGCNMAFRRSALLAVGGFRLSLGTGTPSLGGEDLEIFITIASTGATIAFEPAALVRHTHRQTEEQFLFQVRGYGTGLTAMFFSIVLHDPRQMFGMLSHLRKGLKNLQKSRKQGSPSVETSFPRRTAVIERRGMASGPFAYLVSRAKFRRIKDQILLEFGDSARS